MAALPVNCAVSVNAPVAPALAITVVEYSLCRALLALNVNAEGCALTLPISPVCAVYDIDSCMDDADSDGGLESLIATALDTAAPLTTLGCSIVTNTSLQHFVVTYCAVC